MQKTTEYGEGRRNGRSEMSRVVSDGVKFTVLVTSTLFLVVAPNGSWACLRRVCLGRLS